MKNLKVSMKLIVSFSIVIVLALVLAEMGLWGMKRIKTASDDMYTYNVMAVDTIGLIRENFALQRNTTRELIVYDSATPEYATVKETLSYLEEKMDSYVELYPSTMLTESDEELFRQFKEVYYDIYAPYKEVFLRLTDENQTNAVMDFVRSDGMPILDDISSILQQAYESNALAAQKALEHNDNMYSTMKSFEIGILIIVVFIVVLLVFHLRNLISSPLTSITEVLAYMGSTGDLSLNEYALENAKTTLSRKDEIGQTSRAIINLLNHIWSIERVLSCISDGKFSVEIKMLSDRDTIGMSVSKVADNLNRMFQDMKTAQEEAQTASKAKGAFLAHISHEIRTPLNAIMGMALIAKNTDGDSTKVLECIDQIMISSRHLLSLLNDVLDMSKIESGKLELNNEPFRLTSSLTEICAIISQGCADKDILFTTNINRLDDIPLIGDKTRINQVLINLLGNAVKFTAQSGRIVFNVDKINEDDNTLSLRYTVSDNGIGMSGEQVAKLFKPFEQTDSSIASKYGGTGLGLSISWNIVAMMGGTIKVESEPGVGSVFSFDLCLEKDNTAADTAKTSGDFTKLSGKRLLVVEDIEINRIIICELLADAGVIIEQAENGKQALTLFENSKPGYYDLIIMDIQMPLMDGYEATRLIRASNREDAQTIPIIAMTANAYKEDVERCLAVGMNGHLAKPIEHDSLMEKLASYL